MTAVKVPILTEVHTAYRKARQRAAALAGEQRAIQAEDARLSKGGTIAYNDDALIRRGRELSEAVGGALADLRITRGEAKAAAREALESDTAFRQVTAATAEAMYARVAPLVEYELLRRRAGVEGIEVLALPATVQAEIADVARWTREAVRRGLLAPSDVPPSLGQLWELGA